MSLSKVCTIYTDLAPRGSQWLCSLSTGCLSTGAPTIDVTLKIAIGGEHGDTLPASAILDTVYRDLLHTSPVNE